MNERLQAAVKKKDGIYSVLVINRLSPYLVLAAAKTKVSPNTISFLSFVVAILAALLFARGETASMVAGVVLINASFLLDGVDGVLARYTGRTSHVGGWLDRIYDRAAEALWVLGIAWGQLEIGSEAVALPALVFIVATLIFEWQSNLATIVHGFTPEETRLDLAGIRSAPLDSRGIILGYTRDMQILIISVFVIFNAVVPMFWMLSTVATLDSLLRFSRLERSFSKR